MSGSRSWRARRRFVAALGQQMRLIWPILSALLVLEVLLGAGVARIEEWHWGDGVWFALITSMTIGYGDLVPHSVPARILSVGIGFLGIAMTALLAAVSVRALQETIGGEQPHRTGADGARSVMNHTNHKKGGDQHDPEGDRDRGADRRHGDQAAESESADPAG